jgi:hypothetical protein
MPVLQHNKSLPYAAVESVRWFNMEVLNRDGLRNRHFDPRDRLHVDCEAMDSVKSKAIYS